MAIWHGSLTENRHQKIFNTSIANISLSLLLYIYATFLRFSRLWPDSHTLTLKPHTCIFSGYSHL